MVEEAGWIDDILTDEDPNDQETRLELERAVRQIKTQGIRCKEITHKLLSFARKTDPKIHEVDLNETVNDRHQPFETKKQIRQRANPGGTGGPTCPRWSPPPPNFNRCF